MQSAVRTYMLQSVGLGDEVTVGKCLSITHWSHGDHAPFVFEPEGLTFDLVDDVCLQVFRNDDLACVHARVAGPDDRFRISPSTNS